MSERYVMLVTSLPDLGPLDQARQPPISHHALDRRLRHLDPGDRAILEEVRALLSWSAVPLDEPDQTFVARVMAVLGRPLGHAIRAAVVHRLEVRTAIAGLRLRHRGRSPPTDGRFGFGRPGRQIERNWSEPQFGLDLRFPWLAEARGLLEAGDSLGLERLLQDVIFLHLERLASQHMFDFEAVVLYVLRWQLIERRARSDAPAASVRFRSTVDAVLRTAPPLPRFADG